MTTVGGAPPEEVLATAPAVLTREVPDYTHVPPAAGADAPLDTPNDVNNSSTKTVQSSKPQDWDYAQHGGGDFNMEAPILEEDVVKAGGLGARDELDSFLPSAVDATDYEESLKDAMEYEDVQPAQEGDFPRPGVGFVKSQQQDMDGFREVQQD